VKFAEESEDPPLSELYDYTYVDGKSEAGPSEPGSDSGKPKEPARGGES
jgi:hypothetical protein